MFKRRNSNQILILGAVVFFFLSAILIHKHSEKPKLVVSRQDEAINLHREFMHVFSLGNKRLISDVLWIQTLLESDEAHYGVRDLNSWMYLRFRTIASLDPNFYENYYWGGMFLSIMKDDVIGAADIFERGLELYPDDFKLNYHGGFNYYFEMGDFEKGLKLFNRIEHHPESPPMLSFIINKLRFETSGDYESALEFLKFRLASTKDPVITKKLTADIYALKAQKDLSCLNTNGTNCERKDAFGESYIYQDGVWKSSKPFQPYRINLRK